MKKAAFFDLDGTLVDTLPDLTNIVNATMKDFNYPLHTPAEVQYYCGEGVMKLCERALPQGVSLTEEHMARIKLHYAELQNKEAHVFPGMTEALKALRDLGVRIAVITNKPDFAAQEVIPFYFGDQLIEYVIGNREGLQPKPAPDMVLQALSDMGLEKSDCLYFGDSDTDVMTAKNAGLPSYSVLWGYRPYELLKSAGTDGFVRTPQDIVTLFK